MNKLSIAILALLSSAAAAADFRVTRTDDPAPDGCTLSDCSVREAVMAANAAPGADRIVLRSGTYNLTRIDTTPDTHQADIGPLWVTSSMSFVGAGEGATRLRWNPGYLVKYYNQIIYSMEGSANPVSVSISSMTLSHGRGAIGGCINFSGHSAAALSLDHAVVESCHASNVAGAISLVNSALNFDQVTIRGNSTTNHGGALYLAGTVNVSSRNTLITNNTADVNAGAVYIYGNGLSSWTTRVTWIDNGGSVIENNVAGGAGGAFQLKDTAHLDLSSASTVAPADWLVLRENIAAGVGGAIHNAPPLGSFHSVIQRVRFLENQGSDGGAIATSAALTLSDAEIAGNRAETGVGGGIALMGTFVWAPGRSLARVSLHANYAATGGGAIHSTCLPFTAENVSMHLNDAGGAGRGQALETEGSATLRHLTLYSNTHGANPGAPGLLKRYTTACPDTTVRVANSLIGDYCGAVNGGLYSDGGNQLGPFATNCPALHTVDQRQASNNVFKLGFGAYGGPFVLVGWTADMQTRPQRNFGVASFCSSTDARGFRRSDGLCDAGAYEQ